jgi:hypothetical protein
MDFAKKAARLVARAVPPPALAAWWLIIRHQDDAINVALIAAAGLFDVVNTVDALKFLSIGGDIASIVGLAIALWSVRPFRGRAACAP